MQLKKMVAVLLAIVMILSLCACARNEPALQTDNILTQTEEPSVTTVQEENIEKANIEWILNLDNNGAQEWTYNPGADAWVLSVVSAVAYPELPNQQGVSVCVPGAYVHGIDMDGDGYPNITAADVSGAVKGSLVINYDAQITSTNGQIYTAATAPVIINTGAAGYGSQNNSAASTSQPLTAISMYPAATEVNRTPQQMQTATPIIPAMRRPAW